MVAREMGREMGDSRNRRHGRASARRSHHVHLLLRSDADSQHAHSDGGARGGHVRPQRQPSARWFRASRHPPRRVPQDVARTGRGVDFLRPSKRTESHPRVDEVEGGEFEVVRGRGEVGGIRELHAINAALRTMRLS